MPEPTNQTPATPSVDLGQLTEAVTASVCKALKDHVATDGTAGTAQGPRIIVGIVLEMQAPLPKAIE